ncbi:MAG TPA: hypothetical protein VGG91_24215 [Myxococcaceae bacterium]
MALFADIPTRGRAGGDARSSRGGPRVQIPRVRFTEALKRIALLSVDKPTR